MSFWKSIPLACMAAGALALGGCGIDFHVGNGGKPSMQTPPPPLNAGDGVVAIGRSAADLGAWSHGVDGVVPNLSQLVGAGGGLRVAGALPQPSLAAAAASDACPTTPGAQLPADKICFVTGTKAGSGDVVSESGTIVLYFPKGDTSAIIAIDAHGSKTYADKSTSTITVTDLEAPNGTTAADLGRHWIRASETRYYPAGGEVKKAAGSFEANFRGTSDDQPQKDRDAIGDLPDIFRAARFEQDFADGRTSVIEAYPSAPVTKGSEPSAGTVTRTTSYASGPLNGSVETLVFDRAAATAHGGKALVYADGTTETETITVAPGTVDVLRNGRQGVRETAHLDLTAGTAAHSTVYPGGSPLKRIDENARFRPAGAGVTHIDLDQVVIAADDSRIQTTAAVDADQNGRTTIAYTRTYPDGGVEHGTVTIVAGILSATVEADVTLANGNKLHITGTLFDDGSAQLHLNLDDPATAASPDLTADIVRYPDGSGTATIQTSAGTVIVKRDALGRETTSRP